MRNNKWVRLLAYVTGSVNQELLLQHEYLASENLILRGKLPSRLRLSNPERATLGRDREAPGTQSAPRGRLVLRNPTPFWPGIDDWSPRSSTAPNNGSIQAVPRFSRKWKPWW